MSWSNFDYFHNILLMFYRSGISFFSIVWFRAFVNQWELKILFYVDAISNESIDYSNRLKVFFYQILLTLVKRYQIRLDASGYTQL